MSETAKQSRPNAYFVLTLAGGTGAYAGNLAMMFLDGLSYTDATHLAGSAVIPGAIGGLSGYVLFRLARRRQRLARIVGYGFGAGMYALAASLMASPVREVEVFMSRPSQPAVAFFIAFFAGSVGGWTSNKLLGRARTSNGAT